MCLFGIIPAICFRQKNKNRNLFFGLRACTTALIIVDEITMLIVLISIAWFIFCSYLVKLLHNNMQLNPAEQIVFEFDLNDHLGRRY